MRRASDLAKGLITYDMAGFKQRKQQTALGTAVSTQKPRRARRVVAASTFKSRKMEQQIFAMTSRQGDATPASMKPRRSQPLREMSACRRALIHARCATRTR